PSRCSTAWPTRAATFTRSAACSTSCSPACSCSRDRRRTRSSNGRCVRRPVRCPARPPRWRAWCSTCSPRTPPAGQPTPRCCTACTGSGPGVEDRVDLDVEPVERDRERGAHRRVLLAEELGEDGVHRLEVTEVAQVDTHPHGIGERRTRRLGGLLQVGEHLAG